MGRAERILAGLLRYGALVAAAWMAAGLVLSLLQSGRLTVLRPAMHVNEIGSYLMAIDPVAFITVGVLLLLSLPVLRVGIMVVVFASSRDYRFMAISGIVLLIIVGGFLVGKGLA